MNCQSIDNYSYCYLIVFLELDLYKKETFYTYLVEDELTKVKVIYQIRLETFPNMLHGRGHFQTCEKEIFFKKI